MKTDALIDLLATGAGPVRRHVAIRRFAAAVAIGTVGAFVMLLATFGLNPSLRAFSELPGFWVKIAFTVSLAIAGFVVSQRLSRPGVIVGSAGWLVVLPVIAMWLLSIVVLVAAEPAARAHLVMGDTWDKCPFIIALLSVPAFLAGVWALRGLAPTDHRFAGAAVGLCAGALGASVYSLHCPELAPPFLAVWYAIGIFVPGVIGYTIGPRLLRW